MSTPVFSRTGVPGIGRIDVFPGGRIRIDGDLELDRAEWAVLVHSVIAAGYAARDHDTRPIRRPRGVDEQLDALADQN